MRICDERKRETCARVWEECAVDEVVEMSMRWD